MLAILMVAPGVAIHVIDNTYYSVYVAILLYICATLSSCGLFNDSREYLATRVCVYVFHVSCNYTRDTTCRDASRNV